MKTQFERTKFRHADLSHTVRILACICAAQLLVIFVFKYWPKSSPDFEIPFEIHPEALQFIVDQAEVTRHKAGVPPPPKPRIPNPVPSDKIVEQVIELPEVSISESLLSGIGVLGKVPDAEGDGVVSNPGRPASVIKIVEPVFPQAAQDAKLMAVISVTFLVNNDGNVEDVFVNEIKQFQPDGQFIITNKIGFGLVETTLAAASKWKFRAARHNGKPVRSYVKHEFTFGK